MNLAWKEIKKSKLRFMILGSIIFLVSFLTFIISGLSNGLSQDNAAIIKDLPEGQFYMNSNAEEVYIASKIDGNLEAEILGDNKVATALSIQMGFVNDRNDKQHSVAFVATTESLLFEQVEKGEVVVDR